MISPWILQAMLAGLIIGLYDFWTKKAMVNHSVANVVLGSSLAGALCWMPAFHPAIRGYPIHVDVARLSWTAHTMLLAKAAAMTASWFFAYAAVRALPMSISGGIRASGPVWTLAAGALAFGERLTPAQLLCVLTSVLAYYLLAAVGRQEGIQFLRSRAIAFMLVATLISSLTTVFDKYAIQGLRMPMSDTQAWTALYRLICAGACWLALRRHRDIPRPRMSLYVVLVGVSWVAGEYAYFMALTDPDASVTYLSVFRRLSLVVGFVLSALLLNEKQLARKSVVVLMLLASTVGLVILRH
jgi:transporter family protein